MGTFLENKYKRFRGVLRALKEKGGQLHHIGCKVAVFGLIWGISAVIPNSCSTIKYVPAVDSTKVHYVDSVRWVVKDSVVVSNAAHIRDFAGLLDTLYLESNQASVRAWNDTTKAILVGDLKDKVLPPSRTRIEYRDRIVYRDSIKIEEKPVPYEVEKIVKVVPWYAKVLSWIGAISLLVVGLYIFLKLKKF